MQDLQARGHTPPARCVPTGQLSIPQGLGRGGSHCPSLKLASVPGPSKSELVPNMEFKPMALEHMQSPASRFLQNNSGYLLQKVLPTVCGHPGHRDWVNGRSIEAKALWPVSGHTSHRGVASSVLPGARPLLTTLLNPC